MSRCLYRIHPSELDILSPRYPKKDNIDKICPNSSDIEAARDFLFSIDAHHNFLMFGFSTRLENVVYWLRVSLVSYAEETDIKKRDRKTLTLPPSL